jgi:multidrug efflux pump subunit AcrA (membrane-fusion protein)
VFVAEGPDDKAVARAVPVQLGPIAGNRVSVTSGLKPGQRVIVSGASLLRDGEPVRVIPGGVEN